MLSDAILLACRTITREEFAEKWHSAFLAVEHVDAQGRAIAFHTTVTSKDAIEEGDRSELFEIVKTSRSPYSDRISVGRATNCDIVMRDPSVSKLHAHFRPVEECSFELTDLKSQNGTRVNGRTVAAHRPCRVGRGDTVQFGSVVARLFDAAQLYDRLNAEE